MSTTEQRLAANRANAQLSTGPTTDHGKAMASRNATRHGLLSARLFLDDEEPAEFDLLMADLTASLHPVGAMEAALVERIAVSLWRQRRLVQAETANLSLARLNRRIAGGVSAELGRGFGMELKPEELAPFDPEREQWCRTVLAELEALGAPDVDRIEIQAPLVWQQLSSDAQEDQQTVAQFLAEHKGGISGFIAELTLWCRQQLRLAEARPQVLALAEHVRAKRLVLSKDTLELLARYQTTLDNQLYKALRALREAQDWRLRTLEHGDQGSTNASAKQPAMVRAADAELAEAA
jgi:hypothetical protein